MGSVTAESDWERFTVFLADERAALWLTAEDGAWRDVWLWRALWHALMDS